MSSPWCQLMKGMPAGRVSRKCDVILVAISRGCLCLMAFTSRVSSPQIASTQILWLITLYRIRQFLTFAGSEIHTFLRFASFQIRKFIPKIANPGFIQNTALICLKTVLRVSYLLDFVLCTNQNWSFICYECKYVFVDLEKF
jgi:hypothetical protein